MNSQPEKNLKANLIFTGSWITLTLAEIALATAAILNGSLVVYGMVLVTILVSMKVKKIIRSNYRLATGKDVTVSDLDRLTK
jgi:ABC-type uncharacterized transport system permease subunit